MELKDKIRSIPDFPKQGILFRDITTLLKDKDAYEELIRRLSESLEGLDVDLVVGPEARGFVIGSALAYALHAGFVVARKPGKLPCETYRTEYGLEYGSDCLEIHKDAIDENDVVLLHDDLLATGGTMKAACDLVKKFHPKRVYCNFIIELINEGLNGRAAFDDDIEVTSLIQI